VADIIAAALIDDLDTDTADQLRGRVTNLAEKFPLYPPLTVSNGVPA
jgi:glycine hydroxymethyltransferase